MITLSFPSQSWRWPESGLFFNDWDEYFFTLGYLCNIDHYYLLNDGFITIQIEPNDESGAYGREGRILYYGDDSFLANNFPALDTAKSAGTGKITYRINCNEYVYSLINDFGFTTSTRGNNIVVDVFPPLNPLSIVRNAINSYNENVPEEENIIFDRRAFMQGYNL